MNFIEITTKGGNQVLIDIKEISDIIDTIEDGKCLIYLKHSETYYTTRDSYEEIKMKLLRFAGIE